MDKLKTTSRFVKEIPQDCLQEVGAKPRNSFASDVDTYQGSGFSSLGNTTDEAIEHTSKKKGKIRKGDLVVHDVFGEGIVIKLEGELAVIAFDKKYGIRKILATHASLHKK